MALHGRGRVQGAADSLSVLVQSSLAPHLVSNELRMLELRNLELHLHHVHDLDPRQLGEVLVNYRQLPSMYVHLMITAV